jgi:hypothetical protein
MAFRNLNTEFIVKNNNLLDPTLPVYNITQLQSIPINPNVEEFDVLQYDSTTNQWNTTINPTVLSSNPYICQLQNPGLVTSTGVNTQVPFDTIRIDTSGGTMPDLANDQIVIQKDAKYFISAGPFFNFDDNMGNIRRIQIQKNDIVIYEMIKEKSNYRLGFWISIVSQCEVGDTLKVFSFQDSDGAMTVSFNSPGFQTLLTAVYFGE